MKYLKEYYNYDNQLVEICRKIGIRNWSIRDGLVDVDDNVNLFDIRLTKLPLNFGKVSGNFNCGYNKLTNLEGSPKEVGGDFNCYNNNLTTLEGGPSKVGGNFNCVYNKLTNLEGSPKEVGGDFLCNSNQLTTLEGGPSEVVGDFYCNDNKLTTLEYFTRIGGSIYFSGNLLPKEIWDNRKYLNKIIEYGPEYDIWRDGKLYLPRFRDLMIDIKEGL